MATQIIQVDQVNQISRTGKVVMVEIPEELLRQANLSVGDRVEWTLTPDGTLVLQMPHYVDGPLAPACQETSQGEYEDWKLRKAEAGFAAIDAGQSVDGEAVKRWLLSWGTDDELPMPR